VWCTTVPCSRALELCQRYQLTVLKGEGEEERVRERFEGEEERVRERALEEERVVRESKVVSEEMEGEE
jgi:hypothetical protein